MNPKSKILIFFCFLSVPLLTSVLLGWVLGGAAGFWIKPLCKPPKRCACCCSIGLVSLLSPSARCLWRMTVPCVKWPFTPGCLFIIWLLRTPGLRFKTVGWCTISYNMFRVKFRVTFWMWQLLTCWGCGTMWDWWEVFLCLGVLEVDVWTVAVDACITDCWLGRWIVPPDERSESIDFNRCRFERGDP